MNGAEYAFAVKTFERENALRNILASIRKHYPGIRIYVADDSERPYASKYADELTSVVILPFDSGLAAGRNRLFSAAEEPFLFLCDDDFMMTGAEKPGCLMSIMSRFDLDVLGISLGTRRYNKADRFDTRFIKDLPKQIRVVRGKGEQLQPGVMTAEFVLNCAMFRREAILAMGGWDEDFKVHEHIDFFFRAKKAGLAVAESSKHWIGTRKYSNSRYRKYRRRDFRQKYFEKYGKFTMYAADRGRKRRRQV